MSCRQSWVVRLLVTVFMVCGSAAMAAPDANLAPIPVTKDTGNEACLGCHGVDGFAVPKGETGAAPKRALSFNKHAYADSAHGKQPCVACHTDITEMPHKTGVARTVDCIGCHADTAKSPPKGQDKAKIGTVVHETENFLASVHARPNKDNPARPNATCVDCHSAHYVFPVNSAAGQAYRLTTPDACGRCHEKQRLEYAGSTHGLEVLRYGNPKAATCADCHTAHSISKPKEDPARLAITRNCGSCHDEQYKTYRATYHGQVNALGYTHTAKCFDCHEHHTTRKVTDEASKVSPGNRMETCRQCHKNATAGYLTFQPHGSTHDLGKYPAMWIASKFMILLLAGVFAFFWSHSALWFWREWKDKREGRHHILVDGNGDPVRVPTPPPSYKGKHIRRFGRLWRFVHLALALAVMGLVLTGTSVLYADSFWAPVVIKGLGGAKVAAIIHRTCASVFAVIFFGHILYAMVNTLVLKRGRFRWFGPDSLMPNWQDLRDFLAMVRWFRGLGTRPTFDHWTYWEKFDYWAPFWGMAVIGLSGLSLWFPEVTATYLPGWVFNVATIIHGEEAFLAAVFLFSVHYFNCHFRPTKLPQDLVMFTGTVPLHEFIEERGVEYKRMVETGEIDKYLVDPPSAAKTKLAALVGAALILVGLVLLTLVLLGFWQNLLFG